MVKFDNSGRADYKQLEGLIIKMILNRLTLQTPTARPTEGPQYHAGDSTSSPQSQSPTSSPGRKYDQTFRQTPAAPANINYITYITGGHGHLQPSIDDQQGSDEPEYQGGNRRQNQLHRSFDTRQMPSRQKTAPVNGMQPGNGSSQASFSRAPWSDPKVPSVHTNGPSENPSGPRRSKTDSQTKRINTDDDVFNRLKLFDTVFIVDDTGSMQLPVRKYDPDGPDRWEVTKDALKHVAKIAADHDEDGIDIRFLKAEEFNENNIASGERVEQILVDIDVTDENHGGGTEFKGQLEAVIRPFLHRYEDYIEDVAEFDRKTKGRASTGPHPKEPKFLNVIVITDGQADDEEEVEEYIIRVAKKLDQMDAPRNYIGIQFIQIGDDIEATSFLQRLDDELKNQTNPPIRDVSYSSFSGPLNFADGPFFAARLWTRHLIIAQAARPMSPSAKSWNKNSNSNSYSVA